MNSISRIAAAAVALAFLASPALAAERYEIDGSHTHVGFEINHLGFSTTYGRFNDVSGTIMLDAENPEASSVEVRIVTASLDTAHEERDKHVKGADFLNVEEFPEITFKSTKIERTGETTGKLTGDLTMHGVTKPVTLEAALNKMGAYPMAEEGQEILAAGFDAKGTLKRSDFGMGAYVPMVSDEIEISISLEAQKK